MLVQEFPEIGLTKGGRENARVAQGLTQVSMASPEAIEHGFGWSDKKRYPAMIDLVMEFVTPQDAKRPDPEKLFTNRFAGNTKLSKPEWDQVKRYTFDFVKYLG
jgi:NitT/TauT family transport system substrate-binding protein